MAERWRVAGNWTAALLIAAVFLIAGLWKLTDPIGAAARLTQAKVPESLSVATTLVLGIAETFAGVLLSVPRFRRWGSLLGSMLLLSFVVFIGIHYAELRGADCSCFPWVKRAVGPGFFVADGFMLFAAALAGCNSVRPSGVRPALAVLASIAIIAGVFYEIESTRHTGRKAPGSITAADGHTISLREGKVFIFFFNPQCLHCLDAGRRLAALNWGNTRFIGAATENPRFAGWFMGKAGLLQKGPVASETDALKRTFPFGDPPAGVALEDGYEKAMLLQFEDKEPRATLEKLGFAH